MNLVVGFLVAVCVSVLSAVALAFPLSGLSPLSAAASLGLGAVAGGFVYWRLRPRDPLPGVKPGPWEWCVIVAFALFSLRAFCWLVFTDDDQLQIISPNNLGDIALHITYIRNIANGVPFWPDNPIFAGGKIHYPFGIDVFNSMLTLEGVDVCRGLVWVGLASCLITGIAFYKWGRGFALAGFLFNGGLAGFEFFRDRNLEDFQTIVAWKSIPLAMFVTQRGLLYAIPAGLVLLWSWRERFPAEKEAKNGRPLPLWVEILLYSTMPLFHLHAFIFLSLLLGCWLVWMAARCFQGRQPQELAWIVRLLAWSFLPATVLVAFITGFFESSSMIHLPADWLWMYHEQPQFEAWAGDLPLSPFLTEMLGRLACWGVNFGLFPVFIAALVYTLIRNRKSPGALKAAAFVLPSVAIFIFSLCVMLAPWEWDNTKILIWPYFVVLPFLWDQLLSKRAAWLRAACCFVLYFSGFVSLLGGIDSSHKGYNLVSVSELGGVEAAVRGLPPTAIFAAHPTHNHPLLLNGRNVVAGYPGHLWSHGIDYTDRIADLKALLNGGSRWRRIAGNLHVRYIFWGEQEKKAYPDSTQPWKKDCPLVAKGPWGEIYEIGTK